MALASASASRSSPAPSSRLLLIRLLDGVLSQDHPRLARILREVEDLSSWFDGESSFLSTAAAAGGLKDNEESVQDIEAQRGNERKLDDERLRHRQHPMEADGSSEEGNEAEALGDPPEGDSSSASHNAASAAAAAAAAEMASRLEPADLLLRTPASSPSLAQLNSSRPPSPASSSAAAAAAVGSSPASDSARSSSPYYDDGDLPSSSASTATSTPLARLVELLLMARPGLASEVSVGPDGSLPLHFAASLGDPEVARLVLDKNPEAPFVRNGNCKIPLMYAAREGHESVVRLLLQRNSETACLTSADKNKLALHFASADGHLEVCRLLLRADPRGASSPTQKGKLPLHMASRWGHVELYRLLHAAYPDGAFYTDFDGSLPLHDACRQGQLETSRFLLSVHPGAVRCVNLRGEVPAFPAVRVGNRDLVELLLREWPGAGRHVLRNCSEEDQVEEWGWEMLELLLRGAANKLLPPSSGRNRELGEHHHHHQVEDREYEDDDDDNLHHDGYDPVIVAEPPPPPPPAEALQDHSRAGAAHGSASPRIMVSSPVSLDDTDSSSSSLSSSSTKHSGSSSPMLHHHSGRKRPHHVVLSEGQIVFDRLWKQDQESALKSSLADLALHRSDASETASPQQPPGRFFPLHTALECGASHSAVLAVLRHGPHDHLNEMDDKTGRTPLHWAVCHARIRGENSSATDNGAFALAATQPLAGSLKKKKKKSKASKTKATFGGDLEDNSSSKREEEQLNLVRRLVTPNSARIRDRQGQLALHLAVQNQASWNVVACLLEAHPRSGVLPCSPRPPQSSSVEDNFQESDMDESDRDHYAVGEGDDTEGKVDSSSAASSLPYRLRPVHLACHHGCELSVVYALLRGDPGALCVAEEN